MYIGLVNMYPNSDQKKFRDTLHSLHCSVSFLDATKTTKENVFKTIQTSKIRNWIFTGSPLNVTDDNTYHVPLELLDLKDKAFFFICYSMESVLHQLGYPIVKRDVEKTEYFILEHSTELLKQPAYVFRNHHYYCPSSAIQALSEYNGEAMIVVYKNALMTQFHPEKTADGLDMIQSYFF